MTRIEKEWDALTIKKGPDGTVTIFVHDLWSEKRIEVEALSSAFRLIEQLDREHRFTGTIPIVV